MSTRQTIAAGAALAAAALAVVVARVVVDAHAALARGDAAAARGDAGEAVRRWAEAAHLYAPGDGTQGAALDRLVGLAEQTERAGDRDTSRRALDAARGAILGTRSFYTPHGERLPDIERRLASLYARAERVAAAPGFEARDEAHHLARLSIRPGPSLALSLLALVGFATWVGSAVAFFLRGLDRDVRLRPRAAAVCGAVFVLGFALFLAGLRFA